MRVLPLENEDVNECWLADRDRFSYEALNGDDRLTAPMIKQGGEWQTGRLADRARIRRAWPEADQGRPRRRSASARWPARTARSKSCTWLAQLVRGLGSENIDYRLRHADFAHAGDAATVRAGSARRSRRCRNLQRALVVGSFLRKDHPLFALRIRAGRAQGRAGARVHARRTTTGLMPMAPSRDRAAPCGWVAGARATSRPRSPQAQGRRRAGAGAKPTDAAKAIATRCSAASARPSCSAMPPPTIRRPSQLLALANWIGEQTGATRRLPRPKPPTRSARISSTRCRRDGGLNAGADARRRPARPRMLLNNEPEFDSAPAPSAAPRLKQAEMVVDAEPVQGQPGLQRRAAADRAVHRNAGHVRQCRRPRAELPRRGQAAGRNASGLEGAARAGQPAGPAGLRVRVRRRSPGRARRRRASCQRDRLEQRDRRAGARRRRPRQAAFERLADVRSTSSTRFVRRAARCSSPPTRACDVAALRRRCFDKLGLKDGDAVASIKATSRSSCRRFAMRAWRTRVVRVRRGRRGAALGALVR